MKRVLIVSPHFPPVNAADMQRVRMLLPFLRENGWEAEVLAVEPEQVASPKDPWLEAGLPDDIKVHRVQGLSLRWSRIPGLGTLGLRVLNAFRRRGNELLRGGSFDIVYFSTTVIEIHILGPHWRRTFSVPYAVDYQDPWVSDYYRNRPAIVPPGGRIKFFIAEALHRWLEPRVVRDCSGITSVSPAYIEQLQQRYSYGAPSIVLAFPGSSLDFTRLRSSGQTQQQFDPADGYLHWVYAGVVVPGMLNAIRALFSALSKNTFYRERVRVHFIGTSYAPPGQGAKKVEPIAEEYGLQKSVQEAPERVPYSQALRCLLDASAVLIIGSDETSYTPSKIYPYLLARRPLLAVLHRESAAVDVFTQVRGGVCVTFDAGDGVPELAARIAENWLDERQADKVVPLNENAFEMYSDRAGAAAICRFFDRCIVVPPETNQ